MSEVTSLGSYNLLRLGELVGQPVQTLVETLTLGGAGGLDVPLKNKQTFRPKPV